MDDVADLASRLASHPDYRILRRLPSDYAGGPAINLDTVRRAAIVDTETTGTDPTKDQVIELGLIVFEYGAETGQVGPVVGRYGGLEDPGRPIPPETIAIHHITDEMVKGKHLDDAAVTALLADVSLVIAHNAAFDRPFLEARLPVFATLPWACSVRDIGWRKYGYGSSSLEFLAYRSGFFYEAHRAETDCLAVLGVLAQALGEEKTPAMRLLLECARRPTCRITALNSPYETKDLLKARRYRWAVEDKAWACEVPADERDAEFKWLQKSVYGGKDASVDVETMTARQRYSVRKGRKERVKLAPGAAAASAAAPGAPDET